MTAPPPIPCAANRHAADEPTTHRTEGDRHPRSLVPELLDAIPLPVFYKDREGRYLGFNRAFEDFFGASREELMGRTVSAAAPAELAGVYRAKDDELFTRGGTQRYESRVRDAQGVIHEVIFDKSVLRDGRGDVAGLIGTILDITERKRTEERLAAELRINRAVASISAELLCQAYDLERISAVTLQYARDLTGSRHGFVSSIDRRTLENVRHATTDMFDRHPASEHRHALFPIGPAGRYSSLWGHALNTRKPFFTNLVTNAYHAVEPAGGRITVALHETEVRAGHPLGRILEPGPYVRLAVSDSGPGIDPAVMDKIFEPYFTTKQPDKGTGLGLAVVFGIVKDLGGHITVACDPAGGDTTFDVYLPLLEKTVETDAAARDTLLPTGSEHILLVDDEAPIVRLESRMLERLGYRVTARGSSVAALDTFRADPDAFDLVITDMAMPALTGDQLAAALTAIRADIPIVACTGFSERIDRETAAAMGIRDVLIKPVVRQDLARTVRRVLDGAG